MVIRDYVVLLEEKVGKINVFCRFHHRFSLAPWQLARLEAMFSQCHYPDIYVRERLASEIQLHETRIRNWFLKRRMKWRREQHRVRPSLPERMAG
jgi:Homeodomain